MLPSAQTFEDQLVAIFDAAQQKSKSHVDVKSGELHKKIAVTLVKITGCRFAVR